MDTPWTLIFAIVVSMNQMIVLLWHHFNTQILMSFWTTVLRGTWKLIRCNSHIWQSLSLCNWRWKAAVTLGWMGATFSGSSSWPPHSTASASTGPLSDLLCKIFSWWPGIPVHWMRHSEYKAFLPCERDHSLGVMNGLYCVLNNILTIYVKLLFQWYKMYYEQRPGIAVL